MLPFIYIHTENLIENGNFCLFAAIRNGKRKFVFPGRQTMNGNQRLLSQQTNVLSMP